MRYLLLALLGMGLIIPLSPEALARPVSYPGGWTFITENNGDVNSMLLHYSPTASYSLGYKFEYWRDMDFTFNGIQMNNLLKRWNNADNQANLYLKSGAGVAYHRASHPAGYSASQPDHRGYSATGFTGLAADWESRSHFVSYENRYTNAGKGKDFFLETARVGWAPYEGDYGDIHTWLMLEVQHSPEAQHHFTVTPLVRFFKGVHLMEAGMNNRGELLFNYIYRY